MNYPIVEIEWLDIITQSGWSVMKDVLEAEPIQCKTIGYLVAERETHITVAHSLQPDSSDYTVIPLGCVKNIRKIEVDKNESLG